MLKRGLVIVAAVLLVGAAATIGAASASAETCSTNWFSSGPTINSSTGVAAYDYSPSCTPNSFASTTTLDYKGTDNQWHTAYNGTSNDLSINMPAESCATQSFYSSGSHNDVFVNWTGESCGAGDNATDGYGVKPKNKAPSQGSGSLLPLCQWPFRVHEDRWDGTTSNSPTTAATC